MLDDDSTFMTYNGAVPNDDNETISTVDSQDKSSNVFTGNLDDDDDDDDDNNNNGSGRGSLGVNVMSDNNDDIEVIDDNSLSTVE